MDRAIAFKTAPGQGVNIGRNVWHGILTPLDGLSDFAVVDRAGEGVNLEEHFYERPFLIR
jgi:ureidoglycolate lyase